MWPEPDRPVAGYRSRYGGFWIDRLDGERLVAERLQRSELDATDAERLLSWRRDGFLRLEGAVSSEACRRVLVELEGAFSSHDDRIHYEYWRNHEMRVVPVAEEHLEIPGKLLDMHAFSKEVREAIFSAPALRFLTRLFSEPPMAKDLGIFGVPSFVVEAELFWGNDRLDQAIAWARQGAVE